MFLAMFLASALFEVSPLPDAQVLVRRFRCLDAVFLHSHTGPHRVHVFRDHHRLLRHIDGEIETIILKCLAKERERRYQSAGELARDLRHYLADFYSPIGRPSIDPELMIRMLIVGYCYGIRSERRLCEEAHLNLAYRWFCRLSLEDEVPNHSTFSKNRHGRFRDSDLFRWLFNEVLRRCMDAGLVKGEGFAVDASIIKADASRQRGVPGDEPVNWSDPALSTRAVREYLDALDEEALAETLPKRLSLTDPQARWTAVANNRPGVGSLLHRRRDHLRHSSSGRAFCCV